MEITQYRHFYLVGIKGVAMTSLAQILLDTGASVRGSDSAENFVTQKILDALGLQIDTSFEQELPRETDCVIFTAAHQGVFNPQVLAAQKRGIPTYSQAAAIAEFFNAKKGIAVCGVGGKSTTSAMIAWILEQTGRAPSFSVGVGEILGMERTGRWNAESEYFVAEADEYVTDPSAPSRGEPITPRFSYMHPSITVCTNFAFDHPDVYTSLADTTQAYQDFFNQIKKGGTLIANAADRGTVPVSNSAETTLYLGDAATADFSIIAEETRVEQGKMQTVFLDRHDQKVYPFSYDLPGRYNLENAAYAILACQQAGVPIAESCAALATFQSTKRRFEKVGLKNGVLYFDDYAHHPSEVKEVISAIREWFPAETRIVIAFQSHTFSRTKQLFTAFVEAFADCSEVVLIDIFASAREQFDPSITSDMLVTAVQKANPRVTIKNVHTIENLAEYFKTELTPGSVCLTIGAGDIYKVHDLVTE